MHPVESRACRSFPDTLAISSVFTPVTMLQYSAHGERQAVWGKRVPSRHRTADRSRRRLFSADVSKDPLMVDRIKDAVNAALAAKGWTQVDSGGDVSVVAMEITKNQQTLNTFYDGFGGGWRWGGFGGFGESTTTSETYKVGTLVVDLFDAKAKNLIWRGSSSDTLSNNADKNIKNLDKEVKKMFAHFPPEAKK